MHEAAWYAEASLISGNHVFCAGSLAQCVRKWTRLPEIERTGAVIRLQKDAALAPALLAQKEIVSLASDPTLARTGPTWPLY
jgi:hypothetical protein